MHCFAKKNEAMLPFFSAITPFLCKHKWSAATKKCTIVQFFFANICKCHFFFVTLWRILCVVRQARANMRETYKNCF